jgi:hypothetical protein
VTARTSGGASRLRARVVRAGLGLVVLASLGSTACIGRRRPEVPTAAAWREWPVTLDRARRLAAGGAYARADSLLAGFEQSWATSPEAEESRYWRALLMLDPSNTQASTADAIAMIDRYLATAPAGARRGELELLRRTATLVQALRGEAQASKTAQEADAKARAEELQKLREELARTQAELERVRKRVIRRTP